MMTFQENRPIDPKALTISIESDHNPFMDTLLAIQQEESMRLEDKLKRYKQKYKLSYDGYRYTIWINGERFRSTKFENIEQRITAQVVKANTILDIWDDFITQRKGIKSPRTIDHDIRNYESYIKPSEIASKPISLICKNDVYNFFVEVKTKHPDLTKKYWKNVLGTLSQLVEYAVNSDMVKINVVRGTHIESSQFVAKDNLRTALKWFNDGERKIIKATAYKYAQDHSDSRALGILLLFVTGMRRGELNALTWKDIDEKYIYITKQSIYNGLTIRPFPKTSSSIRRIRLCPEAERIIQLIRSYNKLSGFPTNSDSYLFYDNKDQKATNRQFDYRLRELQIAEGFSEIRSCHDIRRTFATNMYAAGQIELARQMMGHSNLSQTMEYVQPIEKTEKEMSEALEKALAI